jgi:hypothetical protein
MAHSSDSVRMLDPEDPVFILWLVGKANKAGVQLSRFDQRGRSTFTSVMFAGAEVVFGVWQDVDELYGVGLMVLKSNKLWDDDDDDDVIRHFTLIFTRLAK